MFSLVLKRNVSINTNYGDFFDAPIHGQIIPMTICAATPPAKKIPDFPLNRPAWRDAKILVAGRNFGGGSSREAAVYALYEAGFRCVIAPSFGESLRRIRSRTAFSPPFCPKPMPDELGAAIAADPDMPVTVDLEQQTISRGNRSFPFTIDPVSRNQLLNGWDDVDLTDSFRERIATFTAADRGRRPWAQPPKPAAD